MDFRVMKTETISLKGISKPFTGGADSRFEQEHIVWADHHDNASGRISKTIPGIWYGVWDNGTYQIARSSANATEENLEDIQIPGGCYAVFKTGLGGFAGDELPKIRELIFGSWMGDSEYRQTRDYEVEVYHLYSQNEKGKRYYEIWIPVEKV